MHIALKNWRRLNVALTRARKKLVIIGSITSLYEYPFSALSSFLARKNRIIKCPEIDRFSSYLELIMKCYETIRIKEEERLGEARKSEIIPLMSESHIKQKAIETPQIKPRESVNLPPMISTSDFVEYGKVFRYLKEHPNASDEEIAKNLKMLIDRVRGIRALIIKEFYASQKQVSRNDEEHEKEAK